MVSAGKTTRPEVCNLKYCANPHYLRKFMRKDELAVVVYPDAWTAGSVELEKMPSKNTTPDPYACHPQNTATGTLAVQISTQPRWFHINCVTKELLGLYRVDVPTTLQQVSFRGVGTILSHTYTFWVLVLSHQPHKLELTFSCFFLYFDYCFATGGTGTFCMFNMVPVPDPGAENAEQRQHRAAVWARMQILNEDNDL
jgi:hypothetical protein